MKGKCTLVRAQTVKRKQKYLFNQSQTGQSTVVNAYQNIVNHEDFRLNMFKVI